MRTGVSLSFAITALVVAATPAHAQLDVASSVSLDFQTYTGAGLQPTPAASQLDSDEWRITGFDSDPSPAFGATLVTASTGEPGCFGGRKPSGKYQTRAPPVAAFDRATAGGLRRRRRPCRLIAGRCMASGSRDCGPVGVNGCRWGCTGLEV